MDGSVRAARQAAPEHACLRPVADSGRLLQQPRQPGIPESPAAAIESPPGQEMRSVRPGDAAFRYRTNPRLGPRRRPPERPCATVDPACSAEMVRLFLPERGRDSALPRDRQAWECTAAVDGEGAEWRARWRIIVLREEQTAGQRTCHRAGPRSAARATTISASSARAMAMRRRCASCTSGMRSTCSP